MDVKAYRQLILEKHSILVVEILQMLANHVKTMAPMTDEADQPDQRMK